MAFDRMWADLAPVGRDAAHRRLPPVRLDRRRRRAARVVPRRGRGARADVEADRNGNLWAWRRRPGRDGPGRGHRQPPGLGARRRRVRRPAGRGLRLRRAGPAARPRGRLAPAAGHRLLRRRGGRPLRPRLRRAPGCSPGRSTADRARPERRRRRRPWPRRMAAAGHDPAALGPDHETLAPRSAPSSNCTSSRAGPWPTRRPGRRRLRDLAARPLAVRLPRRGQPRRHHPAGRPARPDAALRRDRARPPGRRPGAQAPSPPSARSGRAERRQRDPSLVTRLAGRPRRRPRPTFAPSSRDIGRGRPAGTRRVEESLTAVVDFDAALRDRLGRRAARRRRPVLPTGAGHDAGILSAAAPDRDAVRPQPHRRLPLPGGVRRRGRLPGRRGRPRRRTGEAARVTRPTGASTPGSPDGRP